MRSPITADRILLGLSLAVILIIAAQIWQAASDRRGRIAEDCALFYGSLGGAAEQDCRIRMLKSHALRPAGVP